MTKTIEESLSLLTCEEHVGVIRMLFEQLANYRDPSWDSDYTKEQLEMGFRDTLETLKSEIGKL